MMCTLRNWLRYTLSVVVLFLSSCAATGPTNTSTRVQDEAIADPAVSSPSTDGAGNTLGKAEFIERYLPDIKRGCLNQANVVVRIADRNVLCVFGKISKANMESNAPVGPERHRKYSIAYVRSPGGVGVIAMAIGKELFDNAAYLIVDGPCYSACANFIVPASRRLYMTDGTVIGMHGTFPRNRYEFARAKLRSSSKTLPSAELQAEISSVLGKSGSSSNARPSAELQAAFFRVLEEFEQHTKDIIIPEVEYFVSIKTEEAYVTRFHEVRRTLDMRDPYRCGPDKGLYLIVGPRYLKEFGIRTIREWFPEDLQVYTQLLPKTKEKHSFIFDFDDHPFWHSKLGAVTPADCMSETTYSN